MGFPRGIETIGIRLWKAQYSTQSVKRDEPPKKQEQTESQEKPISPHSVFYRQFSKPFATVCLISIGTYYSMMGLREILDDEPIEPEKA